MISLTDARLIDGLPDALKKEPWVQALSEAIHAATERGIGYIDSARTYSRLSKLTGQLLDILGVENRAPHYNQAFSDDVKRTIVQNAMVYYAHAGTKAAVEDLVRDIYCTAKIEEWPEYNGAPGHYRIGLDLLDSKTQLVSPDVEAIQKIIEPVTRASSHLDEIIYIGQPDSTSTAYCAAAVSGWTLQISAEAKIYGLE